MNLTRANRDRLTEARRPTFLGITTTLFVLAVALWPSMAAIRLGWWPLEDDARTVVRVMDLLQGHLPMSGAQATTGQVDPLLSAHHLGPVEFYALAPFVALDARVGLLIGMGVIHAVSLGLVARAAQRLGGYLLAVPLLVSCALLGSRLEYARIFQPVNTVPPTYFLVLLVLSSALVLRQKATWLPALVLSGTFVAQGQLAYVPVTLLVLGLVSIVGLRDWHVNRGRTWPLPGWPERATPRWRPGWIATVLAALLWFPPTWEALTFRPSNVSQLWKYVRASDTRAPVGPRPGVRDYLGDLLPWDATGLMAILALLLFGTGITVLSHTVASRSPYRRSSEPRWRDPAYLVPGLAVSAFVAEAAILAATLPTGPAVWTVAYWVTPLSAFRAVLWSSTAWLALRWLRGQAVRWYERDRLDGLGPLLSVFAFASGLMIFLPNSASVDMVKNRVVSTPGAQAVPALRSVLEAGDPVRVMYTGGFWFTPVYPTAYRLMGEGWLVCNDFTWPLPQETDFRAWASCPQDSPVIVISREGETLQLPPSLSGSTIAKIGTSASYLEGTEPVSYDTYLLTFPPRAG